MESIEMARKERREEPLTAGRIRNIEPESKRIYVYDTKTPGLRVQVTPAGSKTFQLKTWVKNYGAATISIGSFPKVNVADARKKAASLTGDIADRGREVLDEIREARQEQTFSDFFESWFKDQETAGKRDLVNVRSRYKNHIEPTIGNKRPSALTSKYMVTWFNKLPNRKKAQGTGTLSRSTCNRIMEIVSAVFNKKIPVVNPTDQIKDFDEQSRERYLQGDELNRLFEELATPETPQDLRDIVLIALTTGARKMNILSMRWTDLNIDLGSWIIPAEISKSKKTMHVPLIPEAVNILRRRKRITSSMFVFPGKGKTGHVVDIRKTWGSLLKRADINELRFHDLRRTLGSWQAHNGASLLMIGKSLGHKSTASTEVYARIKDSNPIRESMAGGFDKMVKASKEKKFVNIK